MQNVLNRIVFNLVEYQVLELCRTLRLCIRAHGQNVGDSKLVKNYDVSRCRVARLKQTGKHFINIYVVWSIAKCSKKWAFFYH